jgi:hypothetical protein
MTAASEGPGSRLVEELRLLLDAVAERAGPWLDRVAAEEPEGGEYNTMAAHTLNRTADLVALLRAVLADRWEPGVPHMPGFRPEPRTSPRVQRIPVRRKGKPD